MSCKISLIFIGLFFCLSAHAEYVCVKDGTYIGLLKKNTNVASSSDIEYSSTNKEWKVNFNYKTITGIAYCSSTSGNFGVKNENLSTGSNDTGQYCWCKMEPVANYNHYTGMASFWVYLANLQSDCDNTCTKKCAYAIAYNYGTQDIATEPESTDTSATNTNGFRHKLFNDIGAQPSAGDGCPNGNLVNLSSSSFAALNSNNECDSGYHKYNANASCVDGSRWFQGACVKLCTHSNTETISLAGQTLYLYDEHTTENYLTVLYSGGRCYINLEGVNTATDGVNIQISTDLYHTID